MEAASLLKPDICAAAQVEEALRALHGGTGNISEADKYLAAVRGSPSSWAVCCAIIRAESSTPAALLFAATTVHSRFRADWLAFPDDSHRMDVFRLAVQGLCRWEPQSSARMSPVYFFGRACGFCLSMTPTAAVRNVMWEALSDKVRGDDVLKCNAMAAAVQEVNETSTRDVLKHVETRSFCRAKAREVVATAITVLQSGEERRRTKSNDQVVQDFRAAVLCIQAWQRYFNKPSITRVLTKAICIPQLADDVADTLSEVVGYSGTSLTVLICTCDGLIESFQAACGASDEGVIQHAIAEVACSLCDGNADELMEQSSVESALVVNKVTELLWLCLKAADDRSFFAAAEGWASWIAASNLVHKSRRKLLHDQVAAIVNVVVERMTSFQCESDAENFDTKCLCTGEKTVLLDLLLQAETSLGPETYVKVIQPFFVDRNISSPTSLCAALTSFSVAGNARDIASLDARTRATFLATLTRVMDLLESCIPNIASGNFQAQTYIPVCHAALFALSSYAAILGVHGSDEEFHRAVRCAGGGMLDESIGDEASYLLCALADSNPCRLRMFLPELISTTRGAITRMSNCASEYCVRALSKIASALPSHGERFEAMDVILQEPCKHLLWLCGEGSVREDQQGVCKDLGLISTAVHEMNDNEAATRIFELLRSAIFTVAVEYSSNNLVSKAVCRLLEVCVLPTLLDDEADSCCAPSVASPADDRKERLLSEIYQAGGHRRQLMLAMSCMSLAAECFGRSGKDGEACWLKAVGDIAPHVLVCLESNVAAEVEGRAAACLSTSLGHGLTGLERFADGHYDSQPEMTAAYFRYATLLIPFHIPYAPLVQNAAQCSLVAQNVLCCENISLVREALAWWKAIFSTTTPHNTTREMLGACGGPEALTAGMLCAASSSRASRSAADALFAMCRWVCATVGAGEPGGVLRAYLTAAFSVDNVPLAGLDIRIREMLYRGCVDATGSQREFRRALGEFGRVCAVRRR